MTASSDDCPLLFLDVDGPLIPLRARPIERVGRSDEVARWMNDTTGNPLLDRLDPADGRRLLDLRCRLLWATTWMSDANELVAPRLGLPQLPVVDFPDEDEEPLRGLHWKTRELTRCANGRAFVWLDDEITEIDRRWVEDHHPGAALLVRVDPYVGLAESDLTQVRLWLAER